MKQKVAVLIVDRIMTRFERWVEDLIPRISKTTRVRVEPDPLPETMWGLRRRAMEELDRRFPWISRGGPS